MVKTALLQIATGKRYWPYLKPMMDSAKRYFVPHDVVLFTDSPEAYDAIKIPVKPQGFPNETLQRYHTFLKAEERLRKYDYIFYADVDMLFVDLVGPEIFAAGMTATLHPGYAHPSGNNGYQNGTWERNPRSKAAIPHAITPPHYFCGGFNGGMSHYFLHMARCIVAMVDADTKAGITAVWHDESHLNRYLFDHPPAKILSPSYCYPEQHLEYYQNIWGDKQYAPRLLALEKGWHQLERLRSVEEVIYTPVKVSTVAVSKDQNAVPGHFVKVKMLSGRNEFKWLDPINARFLVNNGAAVYAGVGDPE